MHLILLYGPPASGKLTIAKLLAKETGYRLFHNHLVADFVHTFFEFGTDEFIDLATKLRSEAINAAFQAHLKGLIMTFAYGLETRAGEHDDEILKSIAERVGEEGGSVLFVHLTCNDEDLMKRVGQEDRKEFHKLTDPAVLKQILHDYKKIKEAIPFAESLMIDTGVLSPQEAVEKILKGAT
ncbi:MAG: AAA family ATPase [Patescibacteria group bacterium]|jgi:shikimate kinase